MLLTWLLACASTPSPALVPTMDLAEHRWTHRLLLVFAPDEESPALRDQDRTLAAHADGVEDRRLLVVRIEGAVATDPTSDVRTPAGPLRERFGVPESRFTVVLVGLDGREKRRETRAISAEELFATIDAMPMRQRELRDRSSPR